MRECEHETVRSSARGVPAGKVRITCLDCYESHLLDISAELEGAK